MLIYLLFPILIIIFCKNINKKKFTLEDYILLTLLIIICGLRYNVGTDYALYTRIYYNIHGFSRIELFFTELIKLFNNMNLDVTLFFVFTAFLTTTLFYKTIKKNATHPAESLFLFICMGYYAMQFNIIRQMLAISIIFLGTNYIKNKNFIKYLCVVILASLCHTTALIMLPFYFLANINYGKITTKIIFFAMSMIMFLYQPFMNFITTNFEQYSVYSHINSYTFDAAGIGTIMLLIFHLILNIIIIKNKDALIKINKNNNIYIVLSMFSLFFYFLSINNSILVRPGYYLSIYLVYLLPDLYRIKKNIYNNKNTLLIIIFFIIYYIVHLIFFNSMIPYNSILFK